MSRWAETTGFVASRARRGAACDSARGGEGTLSDGRAAWGGLVWRAGFARCVAGVGLLALVVLFAGGCGPRNYLNENDKLRRENMQLQREIEAVREKLARKTGQLQAVEKRYERLFEGDGDGSVKSLLQQAPVLSQIKLDDYSGPIDKDGDGADDTIKLYVRTLDQQGRMLPVAARARVQVVHIPAEGEPSQLASRSYDAAAFDEAYRSGGLTGEHYTLTAALGDSLPEGVDEVTVKVTVTDLVGDASFTAQGTYRLARP